MNTLSRNILKGIAVGLVASFIKSLAEPPLQKLGEKVFPPEPYELKLRGADVTGHPQNMPPAILAKKVYADTTQKALSEDDTLMAMKVIHYALGAVIGVSYVLLVSRNRRFSMGEGVAAGVAVWAVTHGSTVPMLGLQAKVNDMPASWWVWEFGSHVIFGIGMEQGRKILNAVF
jgi:putative membrane protein